MNKTKNFFLLITTFTFIVTIILTSYFSRNCFFYADDHGWGTYSNDEGILDCLYKTAFDRHGGGYIALFLTKFFCSGLPLILGIHPSDFIGCPQGIFKGICLAITFFLIAKHSRIFYKSNFLFVTLFLFCTLYFFGGLIETKVGYILFNNQFYRYPFTLLFISIFLYNLYKNILAKQKKIRIKNILLSSFAAVVISTNVEITVYSIALFIILLILYNTTLSLTTKLCPNKSFLNNQKFNLNLNFYIPSIIYFITLKFYTFSDSFKELTAERGLNNITFNIQDLKEFLCTFRDLYIIDNISIWVLLILFAISSFIIAYKKKETKKIILPFFFDISYIIVTLSLFLCGRTFYIPNEFWIIYPNIFFYFYLLMLFSLVIYTTYTIRYFILEKKYNSKIVLISFAILLTLISTEKIKLLSNFDTIKNAEFTSYTPEEMHIHKKTTYMLEKMLRFYYLKNETPILPINDNFLCRNGWNNYLYAIYKYDPSRFRDFETKENAMDLFYEKGGSFTKYELEHIRFQRLKNNDFVLNQQADRNKFNALFNNITIPIYKG